MENRPHPGIRSKRLIYRDGQNPFEEGTARFASTEKNRKKPLHNGFPVFPKQENMPSM